jgi:hypothetical protein
MSWLGMWHVWDETGYCIHVFSDKNLMERDHLEDLGIEGKMY